MELRKDRNYLCIEYCSVSFKIIKTHKESTSTITDDGHYRETESEEIHKLLYYYLSQGCGGVLSHWLSSGMKQEPQEIANFIMRASIHTIRGFQEE